MNIFEELEQSFSTLTVDKITPPIISRSDVLDVTEELQRGQYERGETALGENTIYGNYAESTTRYPRTTQVSKGDIIKLKDTGTFYKGIKATADKDQIVIENKDSKTQLLEEAYGTDSVVGLNDTSIEQLSDFILRTDIATDVIYDNI